MKTTVEVPISFDTDFGMLEDVPALFELDVEKVDLEPYSWGQSRGVTTEVTATLKEIHLFNVTLKRDDFDLWIDQETKQFLEDQVANQVEL